MARFIAALLACALFAQTAHAQSIQFDGTTTTAAGVSRTGPLTVSATNPLPVTSAGGGGGAATVADGADVTQGAKADAAVTNPASTASLIALVKGLLTQLEAIQGTFGAVTGNKTVLYDSLGNAVDYTTPAVTNITQVGSGTIQQGHGVASTAIRVELPTDGTGVVGVAAGSATIGGVKLVDTAGTNLATVKAASTAPATTDTAFVVTPSPNPSPVCTSKLPINITSSTDLLTTTAKMHICSVVLVSAAPQNISLVEGTGAVCATGKSALIGGTTASIALAANGGFSAIAGVPWLKSGVTADHICLLLDGGANVSGVITYADAA